MSENPFHCCKCRTIYAVEFCDEHKPPAALDNFERAESVGGGWHGGIDESSLHTKLTRLLSAAKKYLEPQPNDAQSEKVHNELLDAIRKAECQCGCHTDMSVMHIRECC